MTNISVEISKINELEANKHILSLKMRDF